MISAESSGHNPKNMPDLPQRKSGGSKCLTRKKNALQPIVSLGWDIWYICDNPGINRKDPNPDKQPDGIDCRHAARIAPRYVALPRLSPSRIRLREAIPGAP